MLTYLQFRKNDGKSGPYYGSGDRGNFYSLGPMSTAKRSATRDPDGALLESSANPLGKPKPVLVQTDISVHSSVKPTDSLESHDHYWK